MKNFQAKEAWGDSSKMNGLLILLLQGICDVTRMGIIIHRGYSGGGTGYHPKGDAVDFHFIDFNNTYYNQIIRLEESLSILQVENRVGLGLYPAWNNKGFHLDVRGIKARWGWVGDVNDKGEKLYCSYENAKIEAEGE